jgi:hypothetical protein
MFILRLEPPIELDTPKGRGLAILFRDCGHDTHDQWTCVMSTGEHEGEIWTFMNPEVRACSNPTWGREGIAHAM